MSERHIALDRADYYELSALGERMQRLQAEALKVAAQYALEGANVQVRIDAVVARLAAAHEFDPMVGNVRLVDDGCVLVIATSEQ